MMRLENLMLGTRLAAASNKQWCCGSDVHKKEKPK
jgi:hypothetical protein